MLLTQYDFILPRMNFGTSCPRKTVSLSYILPHVMNSFWYHPAKDEYGNILPRKWTHPAKVKLMEILIKYNGNLIINHLARYI